MTEEEEAQQVGYHGYGRCWRLFLNSLKKQTEPLRSNLLCGT